MGIYCAQILMFHHSQELPAETLDERITQSMQLHQLISAFCALALKYTRIIVDEV